MAGRCYSVACRYEYVIQGLSDCDAFALYGRPICLQTVAATTDHLFALSVAFFHAAAVCMHLSRYVTQLYQVSSPECTESIIEKFLHTGT